MTISSQQFLELIRGATTLDSSQREQAADAVTDLVSSYSRAEVNTLAVVLAVVAAGERDYAALESELHALLELGASGFLAAEALSHLREIDKGSVPENLVGYIEDLLSEGYQEA